MFVFENDHAVIPKSLPVYCRPSQYCVKLLSTEKYGFRPSSVDVDRGTTSLNALCVISVYVTTLRHGITPVRTKHTVFFMAPSEISLSKSHRINHIF